MNDKQSERRSQQSDRPVPHPPAGPPQPPAGPPQPPAETPAVQPPTAEDQERAAAASGPQPAGAAVPLPPQPESDGKPDLCGEPHEYKTKTGEKKTKPCIKARGHTGLHSSRQVSVKVDMTVLSDLPDDFGAEDVPGDSDDELLDQITERVRDARQLKVDADVKKAHEKWVAGGKLAGFNENIKAGTASRYTVAPHQAAAFKKLLQRAESANPGIHVRIAPPKKKVDGNVMIYFLGVDKQTQAAQDAQDKADAAA